MRGSFKFHKCHSHFLLAVMAQNAFYLFYIQITFRFIDGALFHDKGAVAQGILVGEKIPLPSGDIGVFAFFDSAGDGVNFTDFCVIFRCSL